MKSGKMESVSAKQSMPKLMVSVGLALQIHGLQLMVSNVFAKKIIIGIPKQDNAMKSNALPIHQLCTQTTSINVNVTKDTNG